MPDFGNPYAATNPYLQMPTQEAPSPWMALANLATGIGTGISQGAASGRGWASGLAPGIMYGNQLTGLQQQNAQQQAMKRWQLGLMAQEYAGKQQDRMLKERQYQDAANEFGPPGATMMSGAAGSTPNRDEFIRTMMPHALAVSQQTGLDPRLVIAQAALETGFGKAAPSNNYFGIKSHGRPGGQVLPTNEAGPGGEQYTLNQSFRTYADPGESAKDYAEFLKTNGRYAPVLQAQGLDAQIDAMGKSGYATDPQYGVKLRQIAQGIPGSQQVAQAGGVPVVPQGDAIAGQGVVPASDGPPKLVLPPKPELPAEDAVRIRRALMQRTMTPEQARAEKNRIENDLWSTQKDEARTRYQVESEMWRNDRSVRAEQARHERDLKEKQEARGETRSQAEQKASFESRKALVEDENKLRDDFDKAKPVQAYRVVFPMLESAKKAGPTRAGDLNLIYAFAKLMDPESVVRESETGMVTATGTFGDRLAGITSQLNGKQALQEDTRKKLIAELDSRFAALEQSYQAYEEAYRGIAKRRGLDFDNIRIPIRRANGGGSRDDYSQFAPTQEELTGNKPTGPIRIDMSGKRK